MTAEKPAKNDNVGDMRDYAQATLHEISGRLSTDALLELARIAREKMDREDEIWSSAHSDNHLIQTFAASYHTIPEGYRNA